MLIAAVAAIVLVGITIIVHYEALRLTGSLLESDEITPIRPRPRLIVVVFAAFAAHTVEVHVFACGYFVLVDWLRFGEIASAEHHGALVGYVDFVYFSAVTYTSLGLGDVFPRGGLRLVSGVEALVGLLMIGWTGSFTYLAMEKLWPLHTRRFRRKAD